MVDAILEVVQVPLRADLQRLGRRDFLCACAEVDCVGGRVVRAAHCKRAGQTRRPRGQARATTMSENMYSPAPNRSRPNTVPDRQPRTTRSLHAPPHARVIGCPVCTSSTTRVALLSACTEPLPFKSAEGAQRPTTTTPHCMRGVQRRQWYNTISLSLSQCAQLRDVGQSGQPRRRRRQLRRRLHRLPREPDGCAQRTAC